MMFRFKALQKMREPDELDSPTLLASPRGWIATFVIGFVICAAFTWSVVGRLPVSVSAPGLLTYPQGTVTVESPLDGVVSRLAVRPGQSIAEGAPLATVTTADGRTVPIPSPFAGTVVGQSASDAQILARGDALVTVERRASPSEPMVAMLFADEAAYAGLQTGQQVTLNVATAPSARFGLLRGAVRSSSPYPLTRAQVAALVGGDLAAEQYVKSGAPHLVLVSLDADPSTASGFAWTSKSGPPMPLRSQVLVTGTIAVGSQTPLSMVFGG
ncbi:HlyD family efflux transporter periplasmic adaptor subunit [Nakamurella aerolata]|uniref:HlyD family efflux transporter periplasmic adaptor subunit n=1 Tax=Nakamurella aerolata TaxID=1656892 RepID=A0A849ADZ6_9ACTN|nr:HlyD family efflux transporter periplasmic adaptor subunit [Nakamurella aerolata]NNG37441.1 hypothetical protein [Nakamurella aerolata]